MKRLSEAMAETRAQLDQVRTLMGRLDSAIARAVRPVPCREPGFNLWLSDRAEDRVKAAGLCTGCSVFAECRGLTDSGEQPTFGVWAGRDYSTRTLRRAHATDARHDGQQPAGRRPGGQQTLRLQVRLAQSRTEIDALDDPRVTRLRELAADPLTRSRAGAPSPRTRVLRQERARLVFDLRRDDPEFWTTVRLAAAVEVSVSTITGLFHDADSLLATGRSR